MLRPATTADTDAVVTLAYDEETAWFGVSESSREEIAHYLRFSGGIESGVVFDDGGRIRACALVTSVREAVVFFDPADPEPPFPAVFGWVQEQGGQHIELQPAATARIAWLEAHGWSLSRSVFDLTMRGATPVGSPTWPPGVDLRPYVRGEDDVAVHRLVYVDAEFAAVPGHPDRPLEMWQQMYTAENFSGWIAERDGQPVGWVMGRVQDDGVGWVYQLAVAVTERGGGGSVAAAALVRGPARRRRHGPGAHRAGDQRPRDRALPLRGAAGAEGVAGLRARPGPLLSWRSWAGVSAPRLR